MTLPGQPNPYIEQPSKQNQGGERHSKTQDPPVKPTILSTPITININIPSDITEEKLDLIFRKVKEHFS